MKKLFLSITTLSLMSFSSVTIYQNYLINESITAVQDMKEWMMQDLEHGRIDPELAEHYMYWLEQTEDNLIEYVTN
jgi:hypothetical protein